MFGSSWLFSIFLCKWIPALGSGISCRLLPTKALKWSRATGLVVWKYSNTLIIYYSIRGRKADLQNVLDAALIFAWSLIIAHWLCKVLFSSNGQKHFRGVMAGMCCISIICRLMGETICFSPLGAQEGLYLPISCSCGRLWAALWFFKKLVILGVEFTATANF